MIYNHRSNETVQDIVIKDLLPILEDVKDEYVKLRRDEAVFVYAPSYIAKQLLIKLLENSYLDNVYVHSDSYFDLLDVDDAEVVITIDYDGELFIEEARCDNGKLKAADGILNYVYDSFTTKDVEWLSRNDASILEFGLEDESHATYKFQMELLEPYIK